MPDTLPLTHFEELMLGQDSRAYPCSCFIRLEFQGELHRDLFVAAATIALDRHPLLRAKLKRNKRRLLWEFDNAAAPNIQWSDGECEEPYCTNQIDLEQETGLQLFVRAFADASDILVHWHHACCDGLGIFQFIHDLLIAYANESGESFALPTLDTTSLGNRGSFGLTWNKILRMVPKQLVGMQGVLQFVTRKPQPIVPHERFELDSPGPDAFPGLAAHHFDLTSSKQLRNAMRGTDTTVNDVLARDLFVALHEFRSSSDFGSEDEWLRMMIPMSLRRSSDRHVPAANIVSSVFLDRRGKDIVDPESLLQTVHEEMELIKRLQLGFTFIFSLVINRLLPGGLAKTTSGKACNTSAVFTNLGKLFGRTPLKKEEGRVIAGNVRLDHISIAAPIAPHLTTAFAAGWYANRLSITLHYDPRIVSSQSAERLLSLFAGKIRASADDSSRSLKD